MNSHFPAFNLYFLKGVIRIEPLFIHFKSLKVIEDMLCLILSVYGTFYISCIRVVFDINVLVIISMLCLHSLQLYGI